MPKSNQETTPSRPRPLHASDHSASEGAGALDADRLAETIGEETAIDGGETVASDSGTPGDDAVMVADAHTAAERSIPSVSLDPPVTVGPSCLGGCDVSRRI